MSSSLASASSDFNLNNSQTLFERARKVIPGGVNSPVRAFNSVGGTPPYITRGEGAYLFDCDGHRYLDYVCSWGPLILGHAPQNVIAAITETAKLGTSFGACCELEVLLAEEILKVRKDVEMIRFVNSGTEAIMSALRLCRGITGREKIIKFNGCYHGHADSVLVKSGSGVATLSLPESAGINRATVSATLTADFNDSAAVEELFETYSEQIAGVVVEPVAGNMGVVAGAPQFLKKLRSLCTEYGALLIFDEVMTGFRIAHGGAWEVYGINADLVCFGKIIGGGLPVGAYAGSRKIMENIAPCGPVYQAGTLSGNPLAMAAGLATLSELNADLYLELDRKAQNLSRGFKEISRRLSVPIRVNQIGSMLSVFFTELDVIDTLTAFSTDRAKYRSFFHAMLSNEIYLPPSALEAWFVSICHSEQDLDRTIANFELALRTV